MSACRILVADDDAEDRAIFADSMRAVGAAVAIEFAADGEQALDRLGALADEALPSLIILDLNMPRLNGAQTLAAIRSEPRFGHIPVVIFSTSVNLLEKERCLQLGAHDYVVKPVSFRESLQTAKEFLLLSGYQRSS